MTWQHGPGTGQAKLDAAELRRLPIGNQHTEELSVIEYQVIKGAAYHHRVSDWIGLVDTSLTLEENVELMAKYGPRNNTTTMRDMPSPFDTKGRTQL